MVERKHGTIKWFDMTKGYGFIQLEEEKSEDVYVHFRSVREGGYRSLREGQQVEFTMQYNARGKQATDVAMQ